MIPTRLIGVVLWATVAAAQPQPSSNVPATAPVSCESLVPGQTAVIKQPTGDFPIRTERISDAVYAKNSANRTANFSKKQQKVGNVASPILTPEEERRKLQPAEGFEVELVASERLGMRKIVDIAFDARGRMWASTATEYPADSFDEKIGFGQMLKRQGVKRSPRVEALWRDGGVDQILIFDNPTAKVVREPILFSEGHAMPMGVLPHKDGAIIIEGERLKYLADTNGDNRADAVTLLADGFGAQDTHTGAHGLKYVPGDWVTVINGVLNWGDVKDAGNRTTAYDRTAVAYVRPDGTDFHVVQKGFQNIWGVHLGVEGRIWMHEANNVGYPLAPFYEHFGVPMTTPKELLYRDYMTLYPPLGNVDLEGTALSGLERSEDLEGGFPAKWQACFFIAHPTPRKVQALTATQRPDQSYELKRVEDLLISKDPNFRPIDLEFGPDGCLYVVDWYNPVISHNEVERDHPLRNKFHTRIWRIRHKSQPKYPVPTDVSAVPTEKLVGLLESKNAWEMHAAWREISIRQDGSVSDAVKRLVGDAAKLPRHRIHGIWSLESLGSFDWPLWQQLLHDESETVRAEALRAMRKLQPDLRVTFEALVALKARETRFHVNKALFNYFVDATHLNGDHVEWLLQWRRPAPKLGKKVIWHRVPTWADYAPSHFSDMVRIALESQPEAVTAYVKDGGRNAGNRQFLSRNVVPRLIGVAPEQGLAQGIKPADLTNPDVRKMVLTNLSDKRGRTLATDYWRTLSPKEAVRQVIDSGLAIDSELAKPLLADALNKLLTAGKAADRESMRTYLKGLLFMNKADVNLRAWAPANGIYAGDFGPWFGATYPELSPLLARLDVVIPGVAESNPVHAVAWIRALENGPPAGLVTTLESLMSQADLARRKQFCGVLAESPRAFAYLLNALAKSPEGFADLDYDTLAFMKERYDQTILQVPELKAQAASGVAALNRSLTAVAGDHAARIRAETERWLKIGSAAAKPSSVDNGKLLFQGLCLSCHQVGTTGAGIGPSLDGSGNRALDALVTAVVDPDAASEANYRRGRVQLLDGTIHEGLVRPGSNAGFAVYFFGGAKIELAASDVAYVHYSPRSFMPTGLTSGLQDGQIADLLNYVKTLK